jgi:hypothetical protein
MRRSALGLVVVGLAVAGCNAIFGIKGGQAGTGGPAGAGGCLPARPSNCDPSLGDDPESCCTSGRSCQGGACSAGECGPVQVADDQGEEVVQILVAGDQLVWSSGSGRRLYTLSISTPNAQKNLLGSANAAEFQTTAAIATDGTYVYFGDYNGPSIGRVPLAGGPSELMVKGNPCDVFPVTGGVPQVAVAAGYVYWAAPPHGIYRVTTSGPFPAPEQSVITAVNTYAVAADDTYLYWGSLTDTSIYRLAHAKEGQGAMPEILVDNQLEVDSLFVDADSIYWSDGTTVWVAGKGGKNQNVISLYSETGATPNVIYGDGRDVYWTTTAYGAMQKGGGSVRRAPKGGGDVHTFSHNTDPNGMGGIAGNCDTIFWLDGHTLGVDKATK